MRPVWWWCRVLELSFNRYIVYRYASFLQIMMMDLAGRFDRLNMRSHSAIDVGRLACCNMWIP